MAKITLIWLILCVIFTHSDSNLIKAQEYNGFCTNMHFNNTTMLRKLQNCTVVVGDLKLVLFEKTKTVDFINISFPNLKEVTGYMVVYRVSGLESLGNLFPNLTRIRGTTLLYNYALVVYDMPHLREVGLYNLLKIDRGGVIIGGGPHTCFVDTIDWNAIAPRYRHVLSAMDIYPDMYDNCNIVCTCTRNPLTNHCWNIRKCQRYLEGPEAEVCSSQCLGCRKTNQTSCSLCREFTYKGSCVSKCPNDTLWLSVSNYCITHKECHHLNGWAWNNSCIFECPGNYVKKENPVGNITCVFCDNCQMTCSNLRLHTLASIQQAGKCVFVNGYLSIHVSSMPNVANELRFYLKYIREVSDYIVIFSSSMITLDFLPSLQRIKGNKLYNDKYSLIVYNMHYLQALFLPNVTQNLKVDNGTLSFYKNPMLCKSQIDKLKPLFPKTPADTDIPQDLNGYSGSCEEVSLGLKVRVSNETSAVATFYPKSNNDVHFTVLYVKIPVGSNASIVPETCSESEWNAINVIHNITDGKVEVKLIHLSPATLYAICIERYDPKSLSLARSAIVNFTTPVGKPKPPFIIELVAKSSETIVIRWVDHQDYKPHITYYELDVYLIDMPTVTVHNHCISMDFNVVEIDYYIHAKVLRPPRNYDRGCESMCGVLSTVTPGALVEEYFDICSVINGCEQEEPKRPANNTKGGVIHTIAVNLTGPRDNFQIDGLSPYRDYKFKLRACTDEQCSRSSSEKVRTLSSQNVDTAKITHADANFGHLFVKWNPPKITNGPLLSYTLEVVPSIKINDVGHIQPQIWCIPGNKTDVSVKSFIASKYFIKICCTTLGSSYICSDLKKVDALKEIEQTRSWVRVGGIIFGILLYIASLVMGWKFKLNKRSDDSIQLVDATSVNRNESEPPAIMLSDFVPLYSIPYRNSH